MATKCKVWLVEPPVASKPTMPLATTFGVDLMAHADIRLAECNRTLHTGLVQGLAQWRVRIDEARAWQLQAHDFHQHLVRIGRAIKGAGARRRGRPLARPP